MGFVDLSTMTMSGIQLPKHPKLPKLLIIVNNRILKQLSEKWTNMTTLKQEVTKIMGIQDQEEIQITEIIANINTGNPLKGTEDSPRNMKEVISVSTETILEDKTWEMTVNEITNTFKMTKGRQFITITKIKMNKISILKKWCKEEITFNLMVAHRLKGDSKLIHTIKTKSQSTIEANKTITEVEILHDPTIETINFINIRESLSLNKGAKIMVIHFIYKKEVPKTKDIMMRKEIKTLTKHKKISSLTEEINLRDRLRVTILKTVTCVKLVTETQITWIKIIRANF